MNLIKTTFALVFLFIVSSVPVSAIEPDKMREVLVLMGFDKMTSLANFKIKQAKDQIPESTDEFNRVWDEVADELIQGDALFSLLVFQTAEKLTDDDYAELIGYFSDGLGRRVTDMENAAHTPEASELSDQFGPEILADLVQNNPARLQLIEELQQSLDVVENSVATAMNMSFAFMAGLASTGQLQGALTDEEMLA